MMNPFIISGLNLKKSSRVELASSTNGTAIRHAGRTAFTSMSTDEAHDALVASGVRVNMLDESIDHGELGELSVLGSSDLPVALKPFARIASNAALSGYVFTPAGTLATNAHTARLAPIKVVQTEQESLFIPRDLVGWCDGSTRTTCVNGTRYAVHEDVTLAFDAVVTGEDAASMVPDAIASDAPMQPAKSVVSAYRASDAPYVEVAGRIVETKAFLTLARTFTEFSISGHKTFVQLRDGDDIGWIASRVAVSS